MRSGFAAFTVLLTTLALVPWPLAAANGDQDGDGAITGPRLTGNTRFRGCFASGPHTDGTVDPDWDRDVDTMTGGLVGTGSWQAADQTQLKNGKRADIEACVGKAKADSQPGEEFVFYFSGHGGDGSFPDGAEAGESAGSDNHIRIGNAEGGADRMTDDELARLLSGFRKSVTLVVILDSCYSHTFYDGANDLGSVTQKDGANDVPATDHLALLAASTPEQAECFGGFTRKLVEGLTPPKGDGKAPADKNRDGTVTAKELADYAGGYLGAGKGRCDEAGCGAGVQEQRSTFRGAGPPLVDNCPTVHNPDQRDANGDGIGDDCIIRTYDVGLVGGGTFPRLAGGLEAIFADGGLDVGGVVYSRADGDVPGTSQVFRVVRVEDAAWGSGAVGGRVCVDIRHGPRSCQPFHPWLPTDVLLHGGWTRVTVYLDDPADAAPTGSAPATRGDVIASFR